DGVGDLAGGRADDGVEAGALLGELLGEAHVADEDGAVAAQEEDAAVAAEAGQVSDVDGAADQAAVEALVAEGVGQALAALGGEVHAVGPPGRCPYCRRADVKRQEEAPAL